MREKIKGVNLMPRYEYECGNGHKVVVKFPYAENLPPKELYCGGMNSSCEKQLKRIYSTFSFTMS